VFLDASNAFDRPNHNFLFTKLIERIVPVSTVRLMTGYYRNQIVQVERLTFRPHHCNQRVKTKVSSESIWVFTLIHFQYSWAQKDYDGLSEIWL